VLPELQAEMPPSVHMRVMQDRSIRHPSGFQRHQSDDARRGGARGGRHVSVLQNGRATLIPALALPFSILARLS